MNLKTDPMPTPIRERSVRPAGKLRANNLRRTVLHLVSHAGVPIIALVTVLCGLPGSQDVLETMGIHLGPSHL